MRVVSCEPLAVDEITKVITAVLSCALVRTPTSQPFVLLLSTHWISEPAHDVFEPRNEIFTLSLVAASTLT
jgi:hypothetical protein